MCVQVFVCLCVLCFYLYVENWYCHYAFAIVKNENVYMRVLIKIKKKIFKHQTYRFGLIIVHRGALLLVPQ